MSRIYDRHERDFLDTERHSVVERCLLACQSRRFLLVLGVLGFGVLIFGAFWLVSMDLFAWLKDIL